MGIIGSLILGAIAGYIAGHLTRGTGFGCWLNIVVGIIGSFLGDCLCWLIGIDAYGVVAQLIVSVIGAIILLWIVSKIQK